MVVAITGANGHLGVRLIRALGSTRVRALVRSERAAASLKEVFADNLDVRIVDYADAARLAEATRGCDYLVHLVGIIKQSKHNSFEQAHEAPATAVAGAAAGNRLRGIVSLSILGADISSENACFASRGRADEYLLAGDIPARIIRVPMVLGEGDYASAALSRLSVRRFAFTFRATSLEQPIDADDVIRALVCSVAENFQPGIAELAGPESLTRRALIHRFSAVTGGAPLVISLPLGIGMVLARLAEMMANPPVTRAMLGVLDHDDDIDPLPACRQLGIELTGLDQTIRRVTAGQMDQGDTEYRR